MTQMKAIAMVGLTALIATGLVTTPVAGAAESETPALKGGHINIPPYAYSEEGHSRGHLVELARHVFNEMGQPVEFVQHPAARLYRQLESGETEFTLGVAQLHTLDDVTVASSRPAATLTLAVYRRAATDPIESLEALTDQPVILIQGYSYGKAGRFLERHADQMMITRARTHESALRMVQYGRADYLLNYQTAADSAIQKHGLAGLERDIIGEVDIHLYVSSSLDGAASLAERWDEQLRELKEQDALPSIKHR